MYFEAMYFEEKVAFSHYHGPIWHNKTDLSQLFDIKIWDLGFSAESYNILISRHWVYVLIDQQDKCSRQGHIMVTVTYRHLINTKFK